MEKFSSPKSPPETAGPVSSSEPVPPSRFFCLAAAMLVTHTIFFWFVPMMSLFLSLAMEPDVSTSSGIQLLKYFVVQFGTLGLLFGVGYRFLAKRWGPFTFQEFPEGSERTGSGRTKAAAIAGGVAFWAAGAYGFWVWNFKGPGFVRENIGPFGTFAEFLHAAAFGAAVTIIVRGLPFAVDLLRRLRATLMNDPDCLLIPLGYLVLAIHIALLLRPSSDLSSHIHWLPIRDHIIKLTIAWGMGAYLLKNGMKKKYLVLNIIIVSYLIYTRLPNEYNTVWFSPLLAAYIFAATTLALRPSNNALRTICVALGLIAFGTVSAPSEKPNVSSTLQLRPIGYRPDEQTVTINLRGRLVLRGDTEADPRNARMFLVNEMAGETVAVIQPDADGRFVFTDTRTMLVHRGYYSAQFTLKIYAPGFISRNHYLGRLGNLDDNVGVLNLLPGESLTLDSQPIPSYLNSGVGLNPPYDSHPLINLENRLERTLRSRSFAQQSLIRRSPWDGNDTSYYINQLAWTDSELMALREEWPPPLPPELVPKADTP